MQRDMDIVRRIALETAQMGQGYALTGVDNVDEAVFAMHVVWMAEADLIKAHWLALENGDIASAEVRRLTWAGCEFADTVRSDTLWQAAKDKVIKPSASWSFSLLRDWLASEIREGFPTLRG